jgi:hypothetical protein
VVAVAATLGLGFGALVAEQGANPTRPETDECADLAETSAALLDAGELEEAARLDELWLRNCWKPLDKAGSSECDYYWATGLAAIRQGETSVSNRMFDMWYRYCEDQ